MKKMKICGIIAEYNPFHNGHNMQLRSAIRKTKADICIIVMSGMFTQRGDIAIAPKFSRAKMALLQGADIVIEMPTCYVLQPAEYFALGGVGILNGLGADYISYGTEAISQKDRHVIDDFINMTNSPSDEFEQAIKANLKEGMAYPQARAEAFRQVSNHKNVNILKSPNAILEIAYRNAIYRLNSKITPVPIPRIGDGYHESAPKSLVTSATAIRNVILTGDDYSDFVPLKCYNVLEDYLSNNKITHTDMLYPYFIHTLATTPHLLRLLPDSNAELFNRMINAASKSKSLKEYIDNVATKRFTSARVSRAVIHSILNISSELTNDIRRTLPLYARVLGVNKDSKDMLGYLTKNSSIPVFTSVANPNLNTILQQTMLDIDIAATNIYNFTAKKPNLYNQDYTQKLTMC